MINHALQWPLQNDSHPYIRLDFILLSQSILDNMHPNNSHWRNTTGEAIAPLRAGVDMSNVTEILSDHYPVYASWADASQPMVTLF